MFVAKESSNDVVIDVLQTSSRGKSIEVTIRHMVKKDIWNSFNFQPTIANICNGLIDVVEGQT